MYGSFTDHSLLLSLLVVVYFYSAFGLFDDTENTEILE